MMFPQFPAGLLLVLLGGLMVAAPFMSRPMPPAVELRAERALVLVCAAIIFIYLSTIIASVVGAP